MTLNQKWDDTLRQKVGGVEYMSCKNLLGNMETLRNKYFFTRHILLANLKIHQSIGTSYSNVYFLQITMLSCGRPKSVEPYLSLPSDKTYEEIIGSNIYSL